MKNRDKEWHIRAGIPDDAAALADFNRRMAEETEGIQLDAERLLPGVTAALAGLTGARYWVAEAAGEVIGQLMVTVEWSDWRNGPIWWIQSVYVAPDWRKSGVFRSLWDRVLEAGAESEVVGYRLYVEKENRSAQSVYERLGMKHAPYTMMEYFLEPDHDKDAPGGQNPALPKYPGESGTE